MSRILALLSLTWRADADKPTSPWRVRALALLCALLASADAKASGFQWRIVLALDGYSLNTLSSRMPPVASRWVTRWLALRAAAGYPLADRAWTWIGSRGTDRQLEYAVRRTLVRGGCPSWSPRALFGHGWN